MKAADVRAALRRHHPSPEWALMFEVNQGTGMNSGRSADAVAMSLWPSRGLELHGYEIKVSRSDWRREAKDPTKAEAVARFCDRWWIVAPPGIVPVEELPPAWGLKEVKGDKVCVIKPAEQTDAEVPTRPFLAALMRRASEADDELVKSEIDARDRKRAAQNRQEIERQVAREVKAKTLHEQRLTESVAAFEEKSGLKIDDFDGEKLGNAVAIVQAMGLPGPYSQAVSLAVSLERSAGRIREALDLAATPTTGEAEG